jgi:predicted AAA+ superfamily ATPase
LLRQGGESLLGRIAVVEIDGFSLDEVGVDGARRLWLRGGLPLSYLAESEEQSVEWRERFISSSGFSSSATWRSSASTSLRRRCVASG